MHEEIEAALEDHANLTRQLVIPEQRMHELTQVEAARRRTCRILGSKMRLLACQNAICTALLKSRSTADQYVTRVGSCVITVTVFTGAGTIVGSFFGRQFVPILLGCVTFLVLSIPFAALMLFPSDGALFRVRARNALLRKSIDAKWAESAQAVKETESEMVAVKARLQSLHSELGKLQKFLRGPITRLSQVNWRELRGIEFEAFLRDILVAHGYRVEAVGGAGDQGVDLIAIAGHRRIAIQAKGYGNPVSNTAVQEVFTGRQIHGCSDAVAITNSSFTKGAVEAAHKTGVRLVDGTILPALITGRIRL